MHNRGGLVCWWSGSRKTSALRHPNTTRPQRKSVSEPGTRDKEPGTALLSGPVVPRLGIDAQGALAWNQIHLDFAPLAVGYRFGQTITQHILVAQLAADLSSNFWQFADLINDKGAAASGFRKLAQQAPPSHFFHCLEKAGGDVDGVNLDVAFHGQILDFARGKAAGVVSTVGDNEQRLSEMASAPHFPHAYIDGVQQGGAPFGRGVIQLALNLFNG